MVPPLQLELFRGHGEMHPQEMVPIQAALKCCEGEMEGMGEMVCLVLGELKDRRERLGYRDQLELGEKRGSKVPVVHKDQLDRRESKE